jgi:hypothetical protein
MMSAKGISMIWLDALLALWVVTAFVVYLIVKGSTRHDD